MFHTHLFSIGKISAKEQRLCFLESADNTPILRKAQDWFSGAITHQAKILLSQNTRHEESVKNMADIRLWTEAFRQDPNLLNPDTAAKTDRLGDVFKPADILSRLEFDSRSTEWQNFVKKTLGDEALKISIQYTDSNGTTQNGPAHKAMLSNEGREALLGALELVMGESKNLVVPDSPSLAIAKKAMTHRYPQEKGILMNEFSQFMDAQIRNKVNGPDEKIVVTPDLIFKQLPPSQLRGAILLGHLGNKELQEMLTSYKNQTLSKMKERDKAHQHLVDLRKGVERNAIMDNGTALLDNFHSMHPAAKLGLGLGMAYIIKKALESQNGLIKALPISALAVYAYLRLIKGDQNALDTMGNATQNAVKFSTNSLRDFGVQIGGLRPSDPKTDQFDEAVKFLDKKALLSIQDGAAAFTSIAQADLSILSDHFTMPSNLDEIPGALNLDEKNGNLVKHLKIQLQKDGLSVSDQNRTIDYLIEHRVQVSEALFNTWFYLGSKETGNMQKAAQLEKKARFHGINGFRKLNGQDRIDYMQIAYDGHRLAKSQYQGSSLLSVMQYLNEQERQTTAQRWLGEKPATMGKLPSGPSEKPAGPTEKPSGPSKT